MCVDISHTKLAANHFGFDFAEGLAQLGPHTAHLHFGDAKGLDGEGLQIGAVSYTHLTLPTKRIV